MKDEDTVAVLNILLCFRIDPSSICQFLMKYLSHSCNLIEHDLNF